MNDRPFRKMKETPTENAPITHPDSTPRSRKEVIRFQFSIICMQFKQQMSSQENSAEYAMFFERLPTKYVLQKR